ncbi:hypothetical protein BBP40_004434 [Aspergillus hancockii]|nr:hypothetical protein BBP40_004434 [Aspergillus hancockii]
MNSLTRRKACNSCIKAKRRCDLQHPACGRCAAKGVHCQYRSTRLHASENGINPSLDGVPAFQDAGVSLTGRIGPDTSRPENSVLWWSLFVVTGSSVFPLGPLNNIFLSPESWNIVRRVSNADQIFDASSLIKGIWTIRQWLRQWVLEGSTVFIHPRLYQGPLPHCLQDAFTSAATYFFKGLANEDVINSIIEERVCKLLDVPTPSNLSGHLVRVQALLVYQIICLFDGDVHQRSLGEKRIPTLALWSSQMLECARISSEYIQLAQGAFCPPEPREETIWKAWVLAESVRRTWMMRAIVVSVYELLKCGRTSCPGGVKFTARAGLWEASSAQSWVAACQQQDVLFLSVVDANRLFLQVRPNEVDGFMHFILTVICGLDAVVTWVSSTGFAQAGTTG